MLKYFVTVTEDLAMIVTLVTLLYALCVRLYGRRASLILRIGVVVGLLAAAALSFVKNTTSLIDTGRWNHYLFIVTLFAGLVFIVLSLLFAREKKTDNEYIKLEDTSWKATAVCISAACLSTLLIFYELPDVLGYPKNFHTGGNGVWSVEFFVRLAGWLAGLLFMFIYSWWLSKCVRQRKGTALTLFVLDLGVLTTMVRCAGFILRPWISRARWLHWPVTYTSRNYPWVFPFAKFVANNTLLFTVIIAGAAMLVPLSLFLYNLKLKGTWQNPAQHRKLKANCRHNRRAAVTALCCFVICLLTMTALDAYVNREVTLSAPETYQISEDGSEIRIALEQVNDGTLHRFEYVTDNKVDVRWIIIKKPNGGAYGIGLDACEVCGSAGYYQRGEQVVCKRCDVVMNINTIGFKGGCNPIPMDYEIADGYIIFQVDTLIAAEKEFK